MNKIKIFLLLSILISCQANNVSTASKESEDKTKTTSLSLLDRLRSLPGLRISGFGRNAQVYLRGQTSINNYREVLFYVNGNRVGYYSSAYQVVLPENIKSIKLLKSASELSIYGGEGRDGVILIKTIN
jgi:outer membrane cobalamin receptor